MKIKKCDQCGETSETQPETFIRIRYLSPHLEPTRLDACCSGCALELIRELDELELCWRGSR